jgi:hypothetical protein
MTSHFFLDIFLQAVDIDTDMDRYVERRCATTVDSTPKSTRVLAIHQGWRKYDGATVMIKRILVKMKKCLGLELDSYEGSTVGV